MSVLAPTRRTSAQLSIDLAAIADNTRRIMPGTTALMAVVKADGYGHGAANVARAALGAGARSLGVTSLDEAVSLRAAGIAAPILSWLNPVAADWGLALRHRIEVAIPSLEHLAAAIRDAPGARIHLHLDTGLARDGAAPENWAALCLAARAAERLGHVRVVGIMGHLAFADRPADQRNLEGRYRFEEGLRVAMDAGLRPTFVHLSATAAALTDTHAQFTLSRVGAGLVGIDPSHSITLRPAMTLTAPLVDVRAIPAGTGVGYGHDWVASAPTQLGLLPLGYADGLPRAASGRAAVQVQDRRLPIVGRISMDMAVVDLGDLPVHRGDVATVFGPGDRGEPTVREWADWSGTIEHEIVVGLGARVHRVVAP